MDINLGLTIARFLAQLSGVSVSDIYDRLSKSKKDGVNLSVIRLLAIFDNDDDPLTGLWRLNSWDMQPPHSKKYVTGELAIFYKDPKSKVWKGSMYLKYCRSPTDKGWLAKRRGKITETAFYVEISKENETTYRGTTTQNYRKPKRELMYSGEFLDIQISDKKFSARFINTNAPGEAIGVFHQRQRWKEVDRSNFLS